MDELIHLLSNPAHWAFEVISGAVFIIIGLATPERFNFVKRLVARHDRDKHNEILCHEPWCGKPIGDPVHKLHDDEDATYRHMMAKYGVPDD